VNLLIAIVDLFLLEVDLLGLGGCKADIIFILLLFIVLLEVIFLRIYFMLDFVIGLFDFFRVSVFLFL